VSGNRVAKYFLDFGKKNCNNRRNYIYNEKFLAVFSESDIKMIISKDMR